jgi:Mg2+/citrate symporter
LIDEFGVKTAGFIVYGIQRVLPVAGMFIFAILYFGVMTDAGVLDPIIDGPRRSPRSSISVARGPSRFWCNSG